jgi:hypothetical protein
MNCPKHIREIADAEAIKSAGERREIEETEEALAGTEPEEDYVS